MKPAAKRKLIIILAVIIVAALGVWAFLPEDFSFSKKERVTYAQFYALVEKGGVSKAVFDKKNITFTADGTEMITQNPESPVLKEDLLKRGIEVSTRTDGSDVFSMIMDLLFYGIFIAVICVVFVKFISPNTFKVVRHTGKNFNDVVGMDALKKDMFQVMDIMNHPAQYAQKGIRMPKGILLEGDPGNGKTLFAKAMASEAKVNFIPAKATDFESMFMAIGPMKVKLLFKKARRRAPCIVFIDEFDGIGTRRNYSGSALETENTRIVTALLNELDGFEASNGILVMAATNSVQALDPALIRPGRFDAVFRVPYPEFDDRVKLAQLYLNKKKVDVSLTPELIAKNTKGCSAAKIESSINRAALIAAQKGRTAVTLEDFNLALAENTGKN